MEHTNFEPLKTRWPDLYQQASLAEQYIHNDPAVAIIKLRCFLEILVGMLYRELKLPIEMYDSLFEQLSSKQFESVVETAIRQKMHAIRVHGNKAAHGEQLNQNRAIQLLKEAYLLGHWFYATYTENTDSNYPCFSIPQPQAEINANIRAINENLNHQLEDAKKELAQLQVNERAALDQIATLQLSLDEARLSAFRDASSHATNNINLQEEDTLDLLTIEDAFAEYRLTDGQQELVHLLGNFLSSNAEQIFLLRGYAGTGKTFITKGLTEYFRTTGRNYVLTAPTGKAAKVISNKTGSIAYTIHKTIYSFDELKEYKVENLDGSETYKFYAEFAVNLHSTDTVYIIDEASMVSDVYSEMEFIRFGSGFLLRDFFEYVNLDHNDHRKKVIFIGDNAQLPPVGMSFSPALNPKYLSEKYGFSLIGYELVDVVRQKAESGVMANAIMLRNALKKGEFNQLSIDFTLSDIAKAEHIDLIDRYIETCDGKINAESIVIAFSNADVAAYNRKIRDYFFPGCLTITAGDKVMAVNNSTVNGVLISNGDFGLVKQVLSETESRSVTIKRKNKETGIVESIIITLSFKDIIVGFKNFEGISRFFQVKIVEHLLYNDEPTLSSDENKAMYVDFLIRHPELRSTPRDSSAFKDTLKSDPYFKALRVKFGYAITCHKAQGSEWNSVFVKCSANQSQLTEWYFRWLYTATTRAAKQLWLLDPPNIKIGSGIKSVRSSAVAILQTQATTTPMLHKEEAHSADKGVEHSTYSNLNTPVIEDSETFGIPETAPFLLSILSRVRDLVTDENISITDITHNQYQEAYTFNYGNDFARINIGYNSKDKITHITAPMPTELGIHLQNLLSSLRGVPIAVIDHSEHQFHFEEEFLNDLHKRIVPLAAEQNMSISNVERLQWSLRYHFVRDHEVVVYDIFFNGKHQFKKSHPVITACTPGQLINDVEALITIGLKS